MSNFALSTLLLLVFVFACGLVLGSLARGRYDQQKRFKETGSGVHPPGPAPVDAPARPRQQARTPRKADKPADES